MLKTRTKPASDPPYLIVPPRSLLCPSACDCKNRKRTNVSTRVTRASPVTITKNRTSFKCLRSPSGRSVSADHADRTQMEDGLSAYICVICGWFLRCCNAAWSVRTRTPSVSQRRAAGAHVHACCFPVLRGRCARAHLRCRSAARSVRACTPMVSRRCARGVQSCAQVAAVLCLRRVRARPLTSRLSLPMFLATTSTIVRFSMLAAVDGMGVLDST